MIEIAVLVLVIVVMSIDMFIAVVAICYYSPFIYVLSLY